MAGSPRAKQLFAFAINARSPTLRARALHVQFYADLHRGCYVWSTQSEMHMKRTYTSSPRELLSNDFSTIFRRKSNRFSCFVSRITNLYCTTFTVPASVMRSRYRVKALQKLLYNQLFLFHGFKNSSLSSAVPDFNYTRRCLVKPFAGELIDT